MKDNVIMSKMDWVKFFTREELVAGLEISSDYLRLALLSQGKDKKSSVTALAEEPLKEGVLSDGLIKNKEEFVMAVKRLLVKSKTKIRYVIVSIPENNVFSKVFAFPKSIRDEKLKETMELSIGFQLPIKLGDVYLDWEKIEGEGKNEVLLGAIPKSVINEYVAALTPTSLKIVAVEFHLLSIARVMPKNDKPAMVLLDKPERMTVGVIKNNILRFIHTISYETVPKGKLNAELKRIINFYEGEYEELYKIVALKKETAETIGKINDLQVEAIDIVSPFAEQNEIKANAGKWLVAAGAAVRGALPRKEDTLISLMPVGTEEAYEYQKAITFSNLIADMTTVASVIFLAVFLVAWFMMLSIQQSLSNQYALFSSLPIPTETAELEIRARHLKYLVSKTDEIVKSTPMWSSTITEIRAMTVPGIILSNLVVNLPETPITLQGTAKDRDAINLLKRTFEVSSSFAGVNVPLTSLEKKIEIPFSISFQLKDSQSVYLK